MLHYYAMRKSIKGTDISENHRFGTYSEMLRQYFLYCASAATNADGNDYDYIDFGTVEQGVIKSERFEHQVEEVPEVEG